MIWQSMNAMMVVDLTIIALVILVGVTGIRFGALKGCRGRNKVLCAGPCSLSKAALVKRSLALNYVSDQRNVFLQTLIHPLHRHALDKR